MATPWSSDALWLGPLIVQRLRAEVAALRQVLLIDDIDPESKELAGQLPGAVVLMQRMQPADNQPRNYQAIVQQQWLVVLVVRQVSRDAAANSTKLGPLITQVVAALRGWEPPGSTGRSLSWQPSSAPRYGRNQSMFPLAFGLQMTTA